MVCVCVCVCVCVQFAQLCTVQSTNEAVRSVVLDILAAAAERAAAASDGSHGAVTEQLQEKAREVDALEKQRGEGGQWGLDEAQLADRQTVLQAVRAELAELEQLQLNHRQVRHRGQ
jgi:hypothetical protein